MRFRCLAVRDPAELDFLVHGQVDLINEYERAA